MGWDRKLEMLKHLCKKTAKLNSKELSLPAVYGYKSIIANKFHYKYKKYIFFIIKILNAM